MKTWIGTVLFFGITTGSVWAQGATPAPAAQPAVFVSIRSPMVDGGIFAVLAAGAIFAVCRSSQRG